MATKTSTTATFVIQFTDPEGAYYLYRAKRLVVTLRGKRTIELEGDRVLVDQDRIVIRLTQGETQALGAGMIEVEVTAAMPHGAVLKTNTMSFPLNQAIRDETT